MAAAPVEAAPAIPDFVYNPTYTFENFIEGPSNRMAFAAAVAVLTDETKHETVEYSHPEEIGRAHV